MGGRQAHGRPLLGQPKSGPRKPQKGKAGSRAAALNAFATAAKDVPASSGIRGPRAQHLDAEPNPKKRHRGDDDEDDDDEDGGDDDDGEDDARGRSGRSRTKRARNAKGGEEEDSSESEYGSDSEGNEFRIGQVGSDDDSELDSDEAFGESDEERFEGFVFRGSSSNKKSTKRAKKAPGSDDEEEDEDEGDEDSLGEDAIDLAQALDQVSDDDEGSSGDTESGSEEDDDDDGSGSESAPSEEEDDDDDEDDPSKMDALQSLVAKFAGNGDEGSLVAPSGGKARVELSDLGLFGVKDPSIRKSLKLMHKEEKAVTAGKPGASQRLDVPLARRQQDRVLRAAASEKANKTLDRWQDTVKHNRRAEHLVFPLPDTLPDAGLDKGELAPLFDSRAGGASGNRGGTELEQTILSIMEESGLGPSAKTVQPDMEGVEGAQKLSQAELQEIWAQRRRDREKQSREQARAARIKKIKSKTYRRVHRRERQANEREEAGEGAPVDSEEEREAQHRARALERVGARHRESKWAKSAKKAGIAAWDEGARSGLAEMARRSDELRRRVEGRATGGGDSEDDSEDDEDDGEGGFDLKGDERAERKRLLRELEQAAGDGSDEPESNLMKMKFMQRGEAARKKENDELVAQIRRELDSDNEQGSDDLDENAGPVEVGRRVYGVPGASTNGKKTKKKGAEDESADEAQKVLSALSSFKTTLDQPLAGTSSAIAPETNGPAGTWSRAGVSRAEAAGKSKKSKKAAPVEEPVVDISQAIFASAIGQAKSKVAGARQSSKPSNGVTDAVANDDDSDSEAEAALHLPLAIRDQELAERAFAGDDLFRSFEQEKDDIAEEDDDKVVDNFLPGWGSWAGEGVSNRQKKANQGRFLSKVEGVKKKKDRKDAKLERVIISERRIKKNDKYLASQLPHVFENKDQYERSLRLPVGPEWTTKQTFQDATKPRIIMKQGIIAPMAKPTSH